MKKTLIKALSSTIALTLVLSAVVGTAPTEKIPADEIKSVKATATVQEVKAEEKEVKADGVLAAIDAKVKEEAIAEVKEAEAPAVEIAKTAAAAEITAPKAEAKEEAKAAPEIKVVPAAEAKAEAPVVEAPAVEAVAPEIIEEEPAEEWNISATEFDNVAMSFYAEPVAPASQVNIDAQSGIVTISGTGAMEEAVYRHFMSTEKFLAAAKAAFKAEYGVEVDLVYDDTITDVVELDNNIRYYEYGTDKELFVTEDMRMNLNPADFLEYSPSTIIVDEGITNISDFAFIFCGDLEEVILPSTIESIGKFAFQYCNSLTRVVVPENAEIKDGAFDHCPNLTEVQRVNAEATAEPIAEWDISATEFDSVAMSFYAEPVAPLSQVEVDTQSGVVYINGEGAMEEAVYRHFMSKEKFLAASEAAFEAEYGEDVDLVYDDTITDVVELDNNIRYYSHETGKQLYVTENMRMNLNPAEFIAYSPRAIFVNDGITNISNFAFLCCEGVQEVTLPASIETIGECAFQYCKNLTTVTIPENAKITEGSFYYCHSLATVKLANKDYYGDGIMAENAENNDNYRTLTDEEIKALVYC